MSVIEELDALQNQDAAIRELEKKVRDLPLRRRQETDRVSGVEMRLEEARAGVRSGEKSIDSIREEILTHEGIIARYEKQRQTLRSAEEYKASGPDFYYQSDGETPTLPLGTAVIQETKAPQGYLLDDGAGNAPEKFCVQITDDAMPRVRSP